MSDEMDEINEITWRAVGDNIEDDCVAEWRGLVLRAEDMHGWWWWAVLEGPEARATCYDTPWGERVTTASQARAACEKAARAHLRQSQNVAGENEKSHKGPIEK